MDRKFLLLSAFLLLLLLPVGAGAQEDQQQWLRKSLRASCDYWANCYHPRTNYRERRIERERAAYERRLAREEEIRDWERCRDRGHRHCGPRPYSYSHSYTSGDYRPQCRPILTTKGGEASTETGATNLAKRAWRAAVRSDWGEIYQDLAFAKDATIRCWRSSTNESILGRASEFLAGAYTKRCQIWARPCLPDKVPLQVNRDDQD